MPIYEYSCESCDHKLEVLQKLADSPLRKCPDCGKDTLKKIISAVGVQLKGTGWYVTDFKGGQKKESVSADNKKDSDNKKQGDSKKEIDAAKTDQKNSTESKMKSEKNELKSVEPSLKKTEKKDGKVS